MSVTPAFAAAVGEIAQGSSRVPEQPFLDPADFSWTRPLEENSSAIRKELDEVSRHRNSLPNFQDLSPDQPRLSQDRGPYKGVLRHHLGLIIPEPALSRGIRVANETKHWEEGKSLVFDDTYHHEAWNGTNGDRVVLFMDFVRLLRFPASLLNWILLNAIAVSPLVLGGAGNYLAWEKRFEKVVNAEKGAAAA